jgi:FkbH-like protein
MKQKKRKKIKCVVWDLDNTLWDGILLEGDQLTLREGVLEIIRLLDSRGILQSIASKNDYGLAITTLKKFGLDEYFLYPQINFGSKASSIEKIAESINISLDTIAFIDDQPFERDEVTHSHSEVLCIDSNHLKAFLDREEMNPRFITEDSKNRRMMYLTDIKRNQKEAEFEGPKESFLAGLQMVLTIQPAVEYDLKRAEELTVRTSQLNATGYTYSFDQLREFLKSPRHKLLITDLEDKYGTYGKIGLSLIECSETSWTIKLLLFSCRVMSRGIGSVVINYIRNEAKKNKVRLLAEFVPTDRNRMLYVTYKFSSFEKIEHDSNNTRLVMLENDLNRKIEFPHYIQLNYPY